MYVGTDAGLYYIDSKEYGAKRRSMINSTVTILALMEDHAGNIYAATDEGIYISADDGVTWPKHLLENARVLELTLDGDHVLAATSRGLYDIAPDGTTTQLAVNSRHSNQRNGRRPWPHCMPRPTMACIMPIAAQRHGAR